MTEDAEELLSDFLKQLEEMEATYYHEAGHAVIGQLYGFRPVVIKGPLCIHDRRTSAFFRTEFSFRSPQTRERAGHYAIGLVAGIAAEAKGAGASFSTLRKTSGKADYEVLETLLIRIVSGDLRSYSADAHRYQVLLWEGQAQALLEQPRIWAAIESVVSCLWDNAGELGAEDIAAAIREADEANVLPQPRIMLSSFESTEAALTDQARFRLSGG